LPAPGEAPLDAARREFHEETGLTARAPFEELEPLRQKGGKLVRCWTFAGDAATPPAPGASTFEIEWPPGSGRFVTFPEVDAVSLFSLEEARRKILPSQAGFIAQLIDRLQP
jgi:predicted NUDIX family NTP pyrophosphohydrolase